MKRFREIFHKTSCNIIGMIHVGALPGTPKYAGSIERIIEKARHEASVYEKHNLNAVLVENMHDIPYVRDGEIGPEVIASMTKVVSEVKRILRKATPCGVQVLACGNKHALAISKACDLQFIRAEGFVFGHVADEGYTDACAGNLLRYRRQIDAENVLIFTDIKKKHCSHAITSDVSLLDSAKAAQFFLSDGIILTGTATGEATNENDLEIIYNGKLNLPILIGSGVTIENLENYYNQADGIIIGSHFKINGKWDNDLCEQRISKFMEKVQNLKN